MCLLDKYKRMCPSIQLCFTVSFDDELTVYFKKHAIVLLNCCKCVKYGIRANCTDLIVRTLHEHVHITGSFLHCPLFIGIAVRIVFILAVFVLLCLIQLSIKSHLSSRNASPT